MPKAASKKTAAAPKRSTRANPSPNGFRQLDDKKPKAAPKPAPKPARQSPYEHAVRNRRRVPEPRPSPRPSPDAVAEASSSEDVGEPIFYHHSSTPKNADAAQASSLEDAGDAVQHQATPTPSQRSQSRGATSTATSKMTTQEARRKRNYRTDTSDDEDVIISNNNTPVDERRTKRPRTSDTKGVNQRLEALFAPTPEQLAATSNNDSSANDGTIIPASSISRSRSSSRQLTSMSDNNSEEAGSDDLSSDTQPTDTEGRRLLGPRSALYKLSQSSGEKMSDDMEVRRKIALEEYGVKIPRLPKTIDGLHYSNGEVFEESFIEDTENENENENDVWGSGKFSVVEYRKSLQISRDFIANVKAKAKSNPSTPVSKDLSQREYQHRATASSRPSTTAISSNSNSVNSSKPLSHSVIKLASTYSGEEIIITDHHLIDTVRAFVKHHQENPASRLPTGAEMTALLADFTAREQNTGATHPAVTPTRSSVRQEITEVTSNSYEKASPVTPNAVHTGEVANGNLLPQTPTRISSQAQESRGWLSGIASVAKSVATTPFSAVFGRRSRSTVSPTTNVDSVVNGAAIAHLPQTSDSAVPLTPVNINNRRRPQTEHKPRSCIKGRISPRSRVPQTDKKRVRFGPIEQRGSLTPEQVVAIHRQQDEDAVTSARQDRRAKLQASVEDAEDFDDLPQPGGKRKRQVRQEQSANFNRPGTFAMPEFSPNPGEEENDSELYASTPQRQPSTGNPFLQAKKDPKLDSTPTPWRFGDYINTVIDSKLDSNTSAEALDSLPADPKVNQKATALSPFNSASIRRRKPLRSKRASSAGPSATFVGLVGDIATNGRGGEATAALACGQGLGALTASSVNDSALGKSATPLYAGTPFGAPAGASLFLAPLSSPSASRLSESPTHSHPPASAPAYEDRLDVQSSGTSTGAVHEESPTDERAAPQNDSPTYPTEARKPFSARVDKAEPLSAKEKRRYIQARGRSSAPSNWDQISDQQIRVIRADLHRFIEEADPNYRGGVNTWLFPEKPMARKRREMVERWASEDLAALGDEGATSNGTEVIAQIGTGAAEGHTLEPSALEEEPTPAAVPNPFLPDSTGMSGAPVALPSQEPAFSTPIDKPSNPVAELPAASSGGLFGRITAPVGDIRIGALAGGSHTKEAAAAAEPASIEPATVHTPTQNSPGHTFGFAYDSSSEGDSSLLSTDGDENANQGAAPQTPDNATSAPLQPRNWTQTPPPKPKPSNAQLPQFSAQPSAADIAKARAEKYKPTVPSKLSQTTIMTPPPGHDKENRTPGTEVTADEARLVEEKKAELRGMLEDTMNQITPDVRGAAEEAVMVEEKKVALRKEMVEDKNRFSKEVWEATNPYFEKK